jgi:hypothetical protein
MAKIAKSSYWSRPVGTLFILLQRNGFFYCGKLNSNALGIRIVLNIATVRVRDNSEKPTVARSSQLRATRTCNG